MNALRFTLVALGLVVVGPIRCNPYKPPKEESAGCGSTPSKPSVRRNDAGQVVAREECKIPDMNCYKGCFKRDETRYCPSCCYENFILCDEGKPYDYESCETAETNPTPRTPPTQK
jgi:hypothetical protein